MKNIINKISRIRFKKGRLKIFGVIICCCVTMNAYYNSIIASIKYKNNLQIVQLEQQVKFMKNDLTTYKDLYKDEKEEKTKKEIECKAISEKLNSLKNQIASSQPIETRVSRGDYTKHDLRTNYIITTSQMNEWINKRAPKGSPFINKGNIFIKASKETGLDPKYIFSHAALESNWGMSNIARQKNNYFGINAQNNNPNAAYYLGHDLETGIITGAKWIKDHYIDRGQSSLKGMLYDGPAYCQNDDGTPRQSWIDQIVNIVYKN